MYAMNYNNSDASSHLWAGLFFGPAMGGTMTLMTKSALNKYGVKPITTENLQSALSQIFSSSFDMDQLNACINKSHLLRNFKSQLMDDGLSIHKLNWLRKRKFEFQIIEQHSDTQGAHSYQIELKGQNISDLEEYANVLECIYKLKTSLATKI